MRTAKTSYSKLIDIEDASNANAEIEEWDFKKGESLWFMKTGHREGKLVFSKTRPPGHPTLSVRISKHPDDECWLSDQREVVLKAWGKRHGMNA